MSSEDQVRPFHSKGEARGQEAAEAVAAVLKHAAVRDQAAHERPAPKKQPKWMLPLGINLGVLAVYLLIAPPKWVVVNPIDPPDLAAQSDDLKRAMWFQAQRIEAYRIQNGRLPALLADAGSSTPGVEYVREGDRYQLIGMVGEAPVIWDSTGSNTEFAALVAGALGG
ncbi:MAG: hypothetical protein Q8N53_08910 [Longimicrobiales bacterium]|nr:hypothetical protein [Longimicrobiales bacterium]